MSAASAEHAPGGISRLMRAALLLGTGGPEMIEVRDDVAVPVPGPGDVLVRVAACGMNNTDINTRVGWYSRSVTGATTDVTTGATADAAAGKTTDATTGATADATAGKTTGATSPNNAAVPTDADDVGWGRQGLSFPRIQGADISGVVMALGDGADAGLLGRRVLVDPWVRDRRRPHDRELAGYLGSERDGGFAEYCAVPAENTYPVSIDLSDEELASFACSWSTAEHMLTRVGLRPGETIAVPGASGGVGSALVSLAKLRGARVTAIASAAKLADVIAIGADEAVARKAEAVVADAVAANGVRFDVVADVVGGSDFGDWLEALRRGGRYVTSGAIAGPITELDLRTLYLNDLTLHGATVYEPAVFANLVEHIDNGRIEPVLGGTFALADIHRAQEAFMSKRHIGSLVITI